MTNKNILQLLLVFVFTIQFFTGCKKWDDAATDVLVGKDLFKQVNETPELSKFAELLTKSGYDKIISSSKTYTVFAPVNSALATLDPAIVADSVRLRMFVANHIANQVFQSSPSVPVRIQMLNGKYNNLQGTMVEDANITAGNRFAKNGYLHIIDRMLPALPNGWEFIESSPLAPVKQKNFMLSLFRNVFNPATAEQIGVDPATGNPVYKPGTDSIRTNLFWQNVHDLRNEAKQFTFFMLADAAWDTEVNKYKPFFVTGTADSTTNLASYEVLKDLAVEGVYLPGSIPDTILSKFNTKVGIDKSAIVQTIKLSNGIVYIMSKVDVRPKDKFRQYIIEGENYSFQRFDRTGNTWFRDKLNPLTGKQFRDVLVHRHGVAQFYLGYRLQGVPALKFRAYWVALNDNINGNTGTFRQKLSIGDPFATALPYVTVTPNNYNEIFLGEFSMLRYSPVLNVYLTADNTTNENTNLITVDYIRLEPVF